MGFGPALQAESLLNAPAAWGGAFRINLALDDMQFSCGGKCFGIVFCMAGALGCMAGVAGAAPMTLRQAMPSSRQDSKYRTSAPSTDAWSRPRRATLRHGLPERFHTA